MITKTKFSTGKDAAVKLARYIERGMSENREYVELYYGFRKMRDEDWRDLERIPQDTMGNSPAVRHMIIAPEGFYDERQLHYLVMKAMNEWRKRTRNYGVRYVWGLHYNTEHPHSHIEMISPYPEDLVMEREDLKEFNKIVEKVFGEKIRGEKELEEKMEKELEEAEQYEVGR